MCVDGQCSQPCTPASPDGFQIDTCKTTRGPNFTCVDGKCAECVTDANCPMVGGVTRVCKQNKCQVKCTKDLDCDPFYKCDMAMSACVFAGCQSQLECVAKTGSPLATCNAGKCDVPCQSDPECGVTQTVIVGGQVMALTSGLQICKDQHCVDV